MCPSRNQSSFTAPLSGSGASGNSPLCSSSVRFQTGLPSTLQMPKADLCSCLTFPRKCRVSTARSARETDTYTAFNILRQMSLLNCFLELRLIRHYFISFPLSFVKGILSTQERKRTAWVSIQGDAVAKRNGDCSRAAVLRFLLFGRRLSRFVACYETYFLVIIYRLNVMPFF